MSEVIVKIDGRSKAARAEVRAAAQAAKKSSQLERGINASLPAIPVAATPSSAPAKGTRLPDCSASIDERQYQEALASADVKSALAVVEGAQARVDSISRKLRDGSRAVSTADLAHWEAALSVANSALLDLARHRPALIQHPFFSAAFVRS